MILLQISVVTRVIIGIAAMVLLFTSFIIAFVINQRKKIEYHRTLQAMMETEQKMLAEQNQLLEQKVEERTTEIQHQKNQLEANLLELETTQLQLVQKEKMASLGEMTSGIAHEIQNPLNFITNFSELNVEMVEELEEELGDNISENAKAISKDLFENIQKVLLHSRRADNIVKSMLEHSRIDKGKREMTSINELAEDSLQLSYHSLLVKFGLKDRMKSNPVKTNFSGDSKIPDMMVVPQDISRVLVNLCNNAIYAVLQKAESTKDPEYAPEIWISTKFQPEDGSVKISIRDNGVGIPPEIEQKIFQPFFTTKPTGEGTGLGLSISYEIITKSHGGHIRVESVLGQGSTFIISLPV